MSRSAAAVEVQYARREPWAPSRRRIAGWARAALGARTAGELSVRVVGNAESRRLNRAYRGKDQPTNVLSFGTEKGTFTFSGNGAVRRPGVPGRSSPAAGENVNVPFFGDLVVCAPVVAREAREQGKSREAHWAHMIVHGTLHLLGYDHERDTDAKRMERREIAILKQLGYINPYETQRA